MASIAVSNQGNAAPHLVDVVVLAGGTSPSLSPLNRNERKLLVKLCNRPLIWFALAPWVEAGFRRFFICVHDDVDTLYKYLSKAFPDVEFFFVLVPSTVENRASTTCDAIRYYVEYKNGLRLGQVDQWGRATFAMDSEEDESMSDARRSHSQSHHVNDVSAASAGAAVGSRDALKQERRMMAALQRDAVVVSCDTLLSGIDIERFVNSFYSSMASASVMLYRPLEQSSGNDGGKGGAGGGEGGGKRKGGAAAGAAHPPPRPIKHQYTCAMYEEDDVITAMAAGDLGTFHNHYHASSQPSTNTPGTARAGSLGGSHTHEDPTRMGGGVAVGCAELSPMVSHRRLHFLKGEDKALDQPIPMSMGFAARRPHMIMEAHLVDPHVYLLRHWVLRYIATVSTPHRSPTGRAASNTHASKPHATNGTGAGDDDTEEAKSHDASDSTDEDTSSSDSDTSTQSSSGSDSTSATSSSSSSSSSGDESDTDEDLEEMSIQKTVLPRLIANQHTLIDQAKHVFQTPDQRIDFAIPQHWLHHGDLSVQLFNAAKGQCLPEQGDNLRIFCTIFEDTPEAPCKAYRINTIENYRAVSEEILAAKCHALHLERVNEMPPEEVLVAEVMQQGSPGSLHASRGAGGRSGSASSPDPRGTDGTPASLQRYNQLGGLADFPAYAFGHVPPVLPPSPPHPFDRLSSFLLPTNPFTLKRRIRYKSLGVYITSSLLETAPETTVRIVRSIIGPNVKLGDNVKITDSVIMGSVEIGDGVTVTRSIVCNSAIILSDRKVEGCVVGPMVEIDRDEEEDIIV